MVSHSSTAVPVADADDDFQRARRAQVASSMAATACQSRSRWGDVTSTRG
jgi:hypothetical protein